MIRPFKNLQKRCCLAPGNEQPLSAVRPALDAVAGALGASRPEDEQLAAIEKLPELG